LLGRGDRSSFVCRFRVICRHLYRTRVGRQRKGRDSKGCKQKNHTNEPKQNNPNGPNATTLETCLLRNRIHVLAFGIHVSMYQVKTGESVKGPDQCATAPRHTPLFRASVATNNDELIHLPFSSTSNVVILLLRFHVSVSRSMLMKRVPVVDPPAPRSKLG
jgi:hypothetical protein